MSKTAKVTLSGTTLKAMSWTPTCDPHVGEALHWVWSRAIEKRRGRGFYREAYLHEKGIESTMLALEKKLDTLEENSAQFQAIHKDAERLRMSLAQFEEDDAI